MKPRLLQYLVCPECGAGLDLEAKRMEGEEVLEGSLTCGGCQAAFDVRGGVPRMIHAAVDSLATEVAESFAWEWHVFDEIRPHYHQQFLDWVSPLTPEDFRGRVVLEGGCGKGRHTALVAGYGAKEVFGVDLGSTVDVAFRNTRHLHNVHIVQADIARLPFARCAEVAYSVGVLHHMTDPAVGFRALLDRVLDGGTIAVWVYAREGNQWIVDLIDPVRTRVTSRLPRRLLYEASRPPAWLVTAASKWLYAPLASGSPAAKALHARLFYRDYLTYLARFPMREIHSIVFDQLVTPVAHYVQRDEVAAWFADPRLRDVAIAHHNGNSWRARAHVEKPTP